MLPPIPSKASGIAPSGFFVLRTPLLPFDVLERWGRGLATRSAWTSVGDSPDFRVAWAADRELLRSRLREIAAQPEVRQAISLASASLAASLDTWASEPATRKGLKTERAFVRYLCRMASRPTPFGLFSGCSVGQVLSGRDASTRIRLAPRASYRVDCRLDFDYLFAVAAALQSSPLLAAECTYRPNPTLRRVGADWHYLESVSKGAARAYKVVRLGTDAFLEAALSAAKVGAKVHDLVGAIQAAADGDEISAEEATEFVQDLVASQVVVSDLAPVLTGPNPLEDLIARLDVLPSGRQTAEALRSISAHTRALAARPLGGPATTFAEPAALSELCGADRKPANWLQVDTFKPVDVAVLGGAVVDDLIAALEVSARFGMEEPGELDAFREAFTDRYEQAWMPLEEVLDEETGIGFGRRSSKAAPPMDALHGMLLEKMAAGEGRGGRELSLTLDDLPAASHRELPRPDAFDVTCTLVAASPDALQKGEYNILLKGWQGPSGARMLGRFCHGHPEIEQGVREHLRAEEAHRPEAVIAEVVYLPEGRVGNVLCRPVLRDFEIVLMGRSGAAPERQLALSDLLVTVDERRQIVLWSKSLDRQVVPRLTSAHGYTNPILPATYRFLCYLQHQGAGGLGTFNWGPLQALPALPRVRVGRVVLSRAQWRLSREEVASLLDAEESARFAQVQTLRASKSWPRWISLAEGDNVLAVDLDNPLSIEALAQVLARGGPALVMEQYPAPDQLCVDGPEGRFAHELVVPFVREPVAVAAFSEGAPAAPRTFAMASAALWREARCHTPGSDWLFVKVYGGEASVDGFTTRVLPALVQQQIERGVVRSWFVVRYTDPDWHVRLRFYGDGEALLGHLLPQLRRSLQPLLDAGLARRITLDTYQREVERYGGLQAMTLAEDIFWADTEAVLAMLAALPEDHPAERRWWLALRGVDRLLVDAGLTFDERQGHVRELRDGFRAERRVDGQLPVAVVNRRFRADRSEVQSIFDGEMRDGDAGEAIGRALDARSARVGPLFRALRTLESTGTLQRPIRDLLPVYVHMHINRVLRAPSRVHELCVHEYLTRLYAARQGRARHASAGTHAAAIS